MLNEDDFVPLFIETVRTNREEKVEKFLVEATSYGGLSSVDALRKVSRSVFFLVIAYSSHTFSLLFTYFQYEATLLNFVAENGYLNMIQYMLEYHSLNHQRRDNYGRHALDIACLNCQSDIVDYLIFNFQYSDEVTCNLFNHGCFRAKTYII